MKTLILVRHGKSSWEYPVEDKDRPLKERGIQDAHLVARQLGKLEISIDFAWSSPANRALHTGMIFLRNLNFDFGQFEITNELYDFSGDSVLDFLKSRDDGYRTILIFGHNYAFTNLVNMLGDRYIDNLPTAGMAVLEIEVDHWLDIKKGRTKTLIFPKQLK